MDTHAEMIWQRGSAREIMREARRRFSEASVCWEKGMPYIAHAHVALASAHYSIVKRYMDWWRKPIAFWHMWRALVNARTADELGLDDFDQIDVVSRVLSKGFPHDWERSTKLLEHALFNSSPSEHTKMKPHTRALILITLGDIERRLGVRRSAEQRYYQARNLISAIEREDSPDREKQLVRVLAAVGFFYYDHGNRIDRCGAVLLLRRALELARQVSKDQEEKILAEWRKRGL